MSTSVTLFDLEGDYLALLELAQDPSIDPEIIQDTMEAIEGEIEDKADGYAAVIDNIKVTIGGIDGEIETIEKIIGDLKAKKEHLQSNIDRMKHNLQAVMATTGKTKFKTDRHSYYFKKNESVVIDTNDVFHLPDDCLTYKDPIPNKSAIKEAIKEGRDFSGLAHIGVSESLIIR